jgi:hypothetical protein
LLQQGVRRELTSAILAWLATLGKISAENSIAATISSRVTRSGQFGTLYQGRFGVFAS